MVGNQKKGSRKMEELITRLKEIPDTYDNFVLGIINYAEKKPERLKKVLHFIESSKNLMTSDIVKFVMDQPDFHEYGLGRVKN